MVSDHEAVKGFCSCCGVPWPCATIRKATTELPVVQANGKQLVRDVIPV